MSVLLEEIDAWDQRLQAHGAMAPMVSRDEAAAMLRVHKATVIAWEKAGKLQSVHLSHRTVRITRESLLKLMQGKGFDLKNLRAS